MDNDCNTLSWLECETSGTAGKKTVEKLSCEVCTQYQSKIAGRRNYSDKWISGASSVRTSNIRDHSKSDQHAHAMLLLEQSQARSKGLDASTYASIAKALQQISESDKKTLRGKFDIAHPFLLSCSLPSGSQTWRRRWNSVPKSKCWQNILSFHS